MNRTSKGLVEFECEPQGVEGGLDVPAFASRCRQMVSVHGRRPVSLLLCDDALMRSLNAQWRGEDKSTDVLSFAFDEDEAPPIFHSDEDDSPPPSPLGEIVISVPTAQFQAREHGWPVEHELTFLFAHGLCHLLGHDHAAAEEAALMAQAENELLSIFGLNRPPGLPY